MKVLIETEMTIEELTALRNKRKDPSHSMWDGAAFGELDASFCFLVNKNMDVLIYAHGDPIEKNFIMPGHLAEKIVHAAMKLRYP
jgi:hypothetical protein